MFHCVHCAVLVAPGGLASFHESHLASSFLPLKAKVKAIDLSLVVF